MTVLGSTRPIGSPSADPCDYQYADLWPTVEAIAAPQSYVKICWERLDPIVEYMRASIASSWFTHFWANPAEHPEETPAVNDLDTIQFFYVVGVNDYLIWQREPDGRVVPFRVTVGGVTYDGIRGILACTMRALRNGLDLLNPDVLIRLTLADMRDLYRDDADGQVRLQLLEARLEGFHEVGRVLKERFEGHFVNLLERAEGWLFREDGLGILQQLTAYFPHGFGDWPFCKLAMVTTRGLLERLESPVPTAERFRRLLTVHDVERLALGADYYRPFYFVRVGLLEPNDELADHLRERRLIERDSAMEREYRAATMVLGREIVRRLGTTPIVPERETWAKAFLHCRRCRVGISDEELACIYKPVCKAYSEDPATMELGWPLVLTNKY
jgi:hypothetical protein